MRRLMVAIGAAGLVIAAIVGLVVWWVIRLGLRPIRQMTEAADAITAGAVERRVEVPAGRTEASRLGIALNTMIDTSQESEARLRRFVADASHELRTPLTTLRGYTSLYASGGLVDDSAVSDSMRRMNSEAARMARIVEDLLLLAELDEHGARRHDSFDLVPHLRDAVSDMRVVQPERPILLDAPESLVVVGDADQLVQVVGALTTNAMRYTPATTEIVVRARHDAGTTRVEVDRPRPGDRTRGGGPDLRPLLPCGCGPVASGRRERPGSGDRRVDHRRARGPLRGDPDSGIRGDLLDRDPGRWSGHRSHAVTAAHLS